MSVFRDRVRVEKERKRREHRGKNPNDKLTSFSFSFFSFCFFSFSRDAVVLACRSLSKGAALKRELIEEAAAAAAAAARSKSSPSSFSSTSSTTLASTSFTPSLEVRQLDVADLDSVRSFVESWGDRPLNILVNNAGIFTMGSNKRETTAKDGLESHLATNHLGHFLLTVRLLPCLAQGARSPAAAAVAAIAVSAGNKNGNGASNPSFFPSRVVSVSSALHAFADGAALAADPQLFVRGYSATQAYANSKLAQVMFTAELRRRIGASGEVSEQGGAAGAAAAAATEAVRRGGAAAAAASPSLAPPPPPPIIAVAVHPGEVLTDVVRSLPAPVVRLYRMLMSTLLLTPQEGARAAVFAATAPARSSSSAAAAADDDKGLVLPLAWDPAKCYLFPDCRPHPPAPAVLDPVLGRWMWGFSAAKVGL